MDMPNTYINIERLKEKLVEGSLPHTVINKDVLNELIKVYEKQLNSSIRELAHDLHIASRRMAEANTTNIHIAQAALIKFSKIAGRAVKDIDVNKPYFRQKEKW